MSAAAFRTEIHSAGGLSSSVSSYLQRSYPNDSLLPKVTCLCLTGNGYAAAAGLLLLGEEV